MLDVCAAAHRPLAAARAPLEAPGWMRRMSSSGAEAEPERRASDARAASQRRRSNARVASELRKIGTPVTKVRLLWR